MLSNRLNDFEGRVQENVRSAIDKGTELLRRGDDPWIRFYIGGAYGYRALYRFRHNWVGAFLDGRRSVDSLNGALAAMPELYDCYFGLGSYHHWRTARSGLLRLVTFWMEGIGPIRATSVSLQAARLSRAGQGCVAQVQPAFRDGDRTDRGPLS